MDDYSNASLEGDMSIPGSSKTNNAPIGAPDFNTLDEPIKETVVSKAPCNSKLNIGFNCSLVVPPRSM